MECKELDGYEELNPVTYITVDMDKCDLCLDCITNCEREAILCVDKSIMFDTSACDFCGMCDVGCHSRAIETGVAYPKKIDGRSRSTLANSLYRKVKDEDL